MCAECTMRREIRGMPQPTSDRILILAINARYSHSNLAARALAVNMPDLQPILLECEIKQAPATIADQVVALQPAIVALGVYIWNRTVVEALLPLLRAQRPRTRIILGGPEISYTPDSPLAHAADCVICGEAEEALPNICRQILAGQPVTHLVYPPLPDLSRLAFPASAYTDADIAHRNLYIETSRGCPCACRFCLSSLTQGVRYYPLPTVFAALEDLLARGAHCFRFVDRSFNLAGKHAIEILQFFLDRKIPDLFLHLEVVPEFLSPALRDVLLRFPPGSLHIETGIQSLSPAVLQRIHRPAQPAAALEGIHWLADTAQACVHADLIAGLPGETWTSFTQGFEQLHRAGPAEIQLGILKHLPGTDLHQEPGMQFSPAPPYEVVASDAMSPADLDTIQRFSAHWERVINRKLFPATSRRLLAGPGIWETFDAFSRKLEKQHGRHGIGLVELARSLHDYLLARQTDAPTDIRHDLAEDYLAQGRRRHLPAFLRP